MKYLDQLPWLINHKPEIHISQELNGDIYRYAIIDYEMYLITNDFIKLKDLYNVWKKTLKKKRIKVKNIIIKDEKINKLKIEDDYILSCDCEEFKQKNTCKHIDKLKKYFNM